MLDKTPGAAAVVAAFATIVRAGSGAASGGHVGLGDLLFAMVGEFLVAWVALSVVLFAGTLLVGLLLFSGAAIGARLVLVLVGLCRSAGRLASVLYEGARAVVVTSVNALLYPLCSYCGHHHERAVQRRALLAPWARPDRPA